MARKRSIHRRTAADGKPGQQARQDQPASPAEKLPNRSRFYVAQIAALAAEDLGITEHAAKVRIYRGIEAGTIAAVRVLGRLMIPRDEAERILEGERP